MNKYSWRKNFTAVASNDEKTIRGKLAFKTQKTHWLDTASPVIVLISIHSLFHQGLDGYLKMEALTSIVKNHVKGKITILLSDRAHIRTLSLKYGFNIEKTFQECLIASQQILNRYQSLFADCDIAFWHSYICEDKEFHLCMSSLKKLLEIDYHFYQLLLRDAEETYTYEREKLFAAKQLFIENAMEDILEQCACIMVLAKKGYRFQFYPGRPFSSVSYVSEVILIEPKLSWVDVFLTIEKKTVMNNSLNL